LTAGLAYDRYTLKTGYSAIIDCGPAANDWIGSWRAGTSDPMESFAVPNLAPKSCLSALSVVNLKSRKIKFASANELDAAQR
jgi:hypothetical protein